MQRNPSAKRNLATILSIAEDRIAAIGELHANLMLSACHQLHQNHVKIGASPQ